MNIDKTDMALLRLLRQNARCSNKALARTVGLAESSCLVRVRRLQDQGVISGFHASIEPSHLAVGLQAMVSIRLANHAKVQLEAFREYVLALDEVIQLYHITGDRDFLVHVWAKDANHLRDFTLDAFTVREEVVNIETGLIFEHTRTTHLPSFLDVQAADVAD